MSPFTRQTLCFRTTICESWGCNERSSSLTDSILALCSVDNWIAVAPLTDFSALPNTTRESPAFATYKSPLHITPTKQHDPTDAICGLSAHCCFTIARNSSSVSKNAFLITLADISWCSEANSETMEDLVRNFHEVMNREKTKSMLKAKLIVGGVTVLQVLIHSRGQVPEMISYLTRKCIVTQAPWSISKQKLKNDKDSFYFFLVMIYFSFIHKLLGVNKGENRIPITVFHDIPIRMEGPTYVHNW